MYYSNGIGSIYDPSKYPEGVPNPYTPRVHAWGGGPWPSEGTRFHGPVYTRPQWGQPYNWIQRPMNGLGAGEDVVVGRESQPWQSAVAEHQYWLYAIGAGTGVALLLGTVALFRTFGK